MTPLLLLLMVSGCSEESKMSRLSENAQSYFDAGDYDEVKIQYVNLWRKNPQNITATQQLGIIWQEQGAPLRAFPFLRKTLELAPDNLPVRTRLARVYFEIGLQQEARKQAIAILA